MKLILSSILITLSLFLQPLLAEEYSFEFHFTKANSAEEAYNYLLPYIIKYSIVEQNDTIETKIRKMVNHVNFLSNPGMFERFDGLGTNVRYNFENADTMIMSGNMYCSEQSVLVADAFEYDLDVARRDVDGHTFHELLVDGRWVIVDPIFHVLIKNRDGHMASVEDIQKYRAGDKSALQLPKVLKPRTKMYLGLFDPKKFNDDNSTRPRPTYFGAQKKYKKAELYNIGVPFEKMVEALKAKGEDVDSNLSVNYLANYLAPNAIFIMQHSANRKKAAYRLQDLLLAQIKVAAGDEWLFNNVALWNRYVASQYIATGRYLEAKKILESIPDKTAPIKYDLTQVYFKLKESKNFLKYKKEMEQNIYYKIMYYQLFGRYLHKKDKSEIDSFMNRDADVRM